MQKKCEKLDFKFFIWSCGVLAEALFKKKIKQEKINAN
jgi:hypothetical protein